MESELKILMLEDLEDDAGLLDRILLKEKIPFTRIRVDTRDEFIEALDSFKPDLILSDHALPQFNSIEALKIARERISNIPFIIVTGTVSEEFAVSCLKKGADDYVLKSNLTRLPLAISHSINEHQHQRIRKEHEEILEKQNAELIKINKELDSFVYNISHHLRSPLASVIGIVNIAKLEERKTKEVVDRYFDMIRNCTLKLDETLKEILDFSQNLRTEVEISEVNLRGIINGCFLKLMSGKLSPKIEKQIDMDDIIPLSTDPHRLSVIMSNLLSNSFKYRDETKPESIVRIKAKVDASQVAISVFDNGVGIKSDHLPTVFDMFVRSNINSDGAGLGLFVVKEVVEKLKGTINITSLHGQWTNVEVTIPNIKG